MSYSNCIYFVYEGLDYVAYKVVLDHEYHQIDTYFVGTMEPIADKNIQRLSEDLWEGNKNEYI